MKSTSVNEVKEWKGNYEEMQQFMNQTKKIIWDTPFIPIQSICRQLPTSLDEEKICDYHCQRIEALKLRSEKDKALYKRDNQATLNRMSYWANTIKQNNLLQ